MPRSSLLFFICKMKRSPQSQFVFVIRHQFNFFRSNIWRAMRIDEEEFFAVISYAVFCLKKKMSSSHKSVLRLWVNKALASSGWFCMQSILGTKYEKLVAAASLRRIDVP